MKNLSQLKNCQESKQKNNLEFLTARFLHDRFCKFESQFVRNQAIHTIRLIEGIIPLEALKAAELSFKLNSLRWFLTFDGKKFLSKCYKRFLLDKEIEKLDLNKLKSSLLNQIASQSIPSYNDSDKKYGENKKGKEPIRTIIDLLR